jgi:MFS family permease
MTGYALGGVAMGQLCDRFGVVVAIMLGTLAVGIGYAGAALVPGPLTFALMHSFIGVGASATFGPLMADMAQWFVRHRGIAVGLAASGNYIGGALWPPVLQHAIAADGWRHTLSRRRGFLRPGDASVHPCAAATRTGPSNGVDARGGE